MAELGTTDNKNDCISDLVNGRAKNDHLEHPFSGLFELLDSVFQVPIVSTPIFIPTSLS